MTNEKQKGPDNPLPSKHMAQSPDDFTKAADQAKDVRPDKEAKTDSSHTASQEGGQKQKD